MKRAINSLIAVSLAIGVVYAAACASSSSSMSSAATPSGMPAPDMRTSPPNPDPRVGLAPGTMAPYAKDTARRVIVTKAAEAYWNMRLLSNMLPGGGASSSPARMANGHLPPVDARTNDPFIGVTHSDLAFRDHYVIQGNYDGYQVWDITNARDPKLYDEYVCRGSQSDVSVYKNLIFVSGEATSGRLDCGLSGIQDSISRERFRGIRIFDATDLKHPKYIQSVQTCRGSHTHTVVEDPKDKENVYVYVSGSAGVRPAEELPGCVDLSPDQDPNGEQFRIEVIQVPLANPVAAHVISKPGILTELGVAPRNSARTRQDSIDNAARAAARGGAGGRGGRGGAPGGGRGRGNAPPRGPVQCHDITVYPAVGYAGGACGGYGLLLDISDVKNPKRLYAAADSNMSFWHSATFDNDGKKVLFSDEWGGGSAPRCRATDKMEWGADALFTIEPNKTLSFKNYYKMPAAQTSFENCVAHNGSLIPIPGRDVMVQAFYQGGLTVFDWTDPSHPKEIAFMDRGPLDTLGAGANGGSWSAYWYNGVIVSSEIGRGLDIFELLPSAFISQHELDAAKTVHYDYLNVQGQQKMVWPASFHLSRAYLDQLERTHGQTPDKIAAARASLDAAEKLSGQARKDALSALATRLHGEAQTATDAPKAHKLAFSVGDLAKL